MADLTRNQELVLRALQESGRAISAYDILALLGPEGITGPPTVYRALSRLTDLGLAHRIEALNAYAACTCARDRRRDHVSQFLVCRGCGQVEEVNDAGVTEAVSGLARSARFRAERHAVEVIGLCAHCLPAH
ncbi:MAG: Fur family transcriptional regulator [Azospirillaceae bacterium]